MNPPLTPPGAWIECLIVMKHCTRLWGGLRGLRVSGYLHPFRYRLAARDEITANAGKPRTLGRCTHRRVEDRSGSGQNSHVAMGCPHSDSRRVCMI